MPPHREPSGDDLTVSIADQLSQLITATHTASTSTSTQLAALIETTTNLASNIAKLSEQLVTDKPRYESPKTHEETSSSSFNNRPTHPKPPKINLPLFDGTNPLGWLFQAENFFNYYRIPHEERVELTVFHFIGDALS